MQGININEAIQRMKEGGEFSLVFVRATGNNCGSLKTIERASYGASIRQNKPQKTVKKTLDRKHVYKGTLPITDRISGRYITPLLSHILFFNSYKVYH